MLRKVIIGIAADLARRLDVDVRDGAVARQEEARWGEAVRDLDELCGEHQVALVRAEQAERELDRRATPQACGFCGRVPHGWSGAPVHVGQAVKCCACDREPKDLAEAFSGTWRVYHTTDAYRCPGCALSHDASFGGAA